LASYGVTLPTIPFHLTSLATLTTTVLPTSNSEFVGDAPTVSRILDSGHTTLGNILNAQSPTSVEMLLLVPIPTYQGRYLII